MNYVEIEWINVVGGELKVFVKGVDLVEVKCVIWYGVCKVNIVMDLCLFWICVNWEFF